ncbi:MAG TPA: LCP family protein [Clostridiales bacterium]|nr:LCP family protein [Clostridiales bacterium]
MSEYSSDNNKNKNNGKKQTGHQTGNNRKYDDYVFIDDREYEDIYSNSSHGENGQKEKPKTKQTKAPPRRKKKRHIFLKAVAIILLAVIAAGGAGVYSIISLLDEITYEKGNKHENTFIESSSLLSSDNVKNILLIGVDSRQENINTRSDTMMLISLNSAKKELVLTSFMRDLYVKIPDNGHNRLNSANVFGGPQLLMDTIEVNYNIDIDNYMLVTFDVFRKLIDGIGGVYADITKEEADYMHGSYVNLPHIKAGDNIRLNGKEALWYCRIRKLDSDFHRTERQKEIVKSIISQVLKTSPVKLYGLAEEMASLIKTDLTKDEILLLARFIPTLYMGFDIKSITVPADDTWYYASRYGMSVIVADENKNAKYLETEIYK